MAMLCWLTSTLCVIYLPNTRNTNLCEVGRQDPQSSRRYLPQQMTAVPGRARRTFEMVEEPACRCVGAAMRAVLSSASHQNHIENKATQSCSLKARHA